MIYATLKALFEAICDALREKSGEDGSIRHQEIPDKIRAISGSTDMSGATAAKENVLSGKTFFSANGYQTGTMPDNGKINGKIDGINDETYSIAEGYTSGGEVSLTDDIREEVSAQDALIEQVSTILDGKMSAYPDISFDATSGTLTITEV